jgi:hypothetical protein
MIKPDTQVHLKYKNLIYVITVIVLWNRLGLTIEGNREACGVPMGPILQVLVGDHGHLDNYGNKGEGKSSLNTVAVLEAELIGISEKLDVEDKGEKERR